MLNIHKLRGSGTGVAQVARNVAPPQRTRLAALRSVGHNSSDLAWHHNQSTRTHLHDARGYTDAARAAACPQLVQHLDQPAPGPREQA